MAGIASPRPLPSRDPRGWLRPLPWPLPSPPPTLAAAAPPLPAASLLRLPKRARAIPADMPLPARGESRPCRRHHRYRCRPCCRCCRRRAVSPASSAGSAGGWGGEGGEGEEGEEEAENLAALYGGARWEEGELEGVWGGWNPTAVRRRRRRRRKARAPWRGRGSAAAARAPLGPQSAARGLHSGLMSHCARMPGAWEFFR